VLATDSIVGQSAVLTIKGENMKPDPKNLLEIAGIKIFVNPDQLSLLLLGTEYHNASVNINPAFTAFGSGCGQLAALFGNLDPDIPKAIIGATDIAMREHLPPDILALTVNKPMYRQLCELDENSFLYKPFWKRLRKARAEVINNAH